MRIDIACFTARGQELGAKLSRGLREQGDETSVVRCGTGSETLRDWTTARFPAAGALVFVGAVGIAVRAIAPLVASKTSDPAVVVVDEAGRHAISLLSGHLGGANGLTLRIAGLVDAEPVITTATDLNGVFAVDVWAREQGFAVVNPEAIKTVSAKLLAGETLKVKCALPTTGPLPPGLVLSDDGFDLLVDIGSFSFPGALHLVPPVAVLGVGCRKGTSVESIESAFMALCEAERLRPEAFRKACSVDLKKDEAGLVEFCRRRGFEFETFRAAELAATAGDFASSPFVESVAGVDNVCERAAVRGSGGKLRVGKTVGNGVALAVAVSERTINFASKAGESE